ncbi:MAG: AMP-binding protein [Muribaculaceae bacterium]|nr:AMP-binding protein [Muribaculaceae bacterium]
MKLIESTQLANRFIEQWNDSNDHIIAHTSGSTGKPKEIKLLKSDMIESARATCRFFNIDKNSVLVSPLSADYIAGKMMIIRSIVSDATLAMTEPSNHPDLKRFDKIDLLPVVPSQVDAILADPLNVNRINHLLVGGGKTDESLEKRIAQSGIDAWASYGMTETCSHVAVRRLGDPDSCYHALPGITFSIDSDSCLAIHSDNFSWKSLQTNDIVELVDNQSFRWLGRRDNVINSGGIKIIPEVVEQKISHIIDVPFYIVGRPDPKWSEAVILYLESEQTLDTKILADEISKTLSPYERPKEIVVVRQFERTSSNKIKRKIIGS